MAAMERARLVAKMDGRASGSGSDSDGEERSGGRGMTHVEEQEALRRAFVEAGKVGSGSGSGSGSGGLEVVRRESGGEGGGMVVDGDNPLARYFDAKEGGKGLSSDDKFLRDYVLGGGWLEPRDTLAPAVVTDDHYGLDESVDDSEDAEAETLAEAFEAVHNFRHEEGPEAEQIRSYAREVQGSMRKASAKRAEARRAKKEREREALQTRKDEVKRLKKLKEEEIAERVRQLEAMAGTKGFSAVDVEGEYDPAEHEKRMAVMFNESYYEDAGEKPQFDVHDDDDWFASKGIDLGSNSGSGSGGDGGAGGASAGPEASGGAGGKSLDALYEELYQLDFEDVAGGKEVRFKYREVAPETFGMTVTDILTLSDAELNSVIGLKKLAPYRDDVRPERYERKFAKFMAKHAKANPDEVEPRTAADDAEIERIRSSWKTLDLRETKARVAKADKRTKSRKRGGKVEKRKARRRAKAEAAAAAAAAAKVQIVDEDVASRKRGRESDDGGEPAAKKAKRSAGDASGRSEETSKEKTKDKAKEKAKDKKKKKKKKKNKDWVDFSKDLTEDKRFLVKAGREHGVSRKRMESYGIKKVF